MKFRSIPQIPAGVAPDVRRFLEAVRENFEILAGQRGQLDPIQPGALSDGALEWNDSGNQLFPGSRRSNWGSRVQAVEGNDAALFFLSDNGGAYVAGNAYWDGTNWRYKRDGGASCVISDGVNGNVYLRTAASGLAGAVIAWADKLVVSSSGNSAGLDLTHSLIDTFRLSYAANHSRYIHLKTDLDLLTENQMISVTFRGHSYGESKPIYTSLCFYSYTPDGPSLNNVGYYGSHACSAYNSADNKAVLVIDIPTGQYYTAFTMSQNTTAQGMRKLNITANTSSASATGAY